MKLLKILLLLVVGAVLLTNCAPGISFKEDNIKGELGTNPQDIQALSQAEMRHTVSTLGQNIAQSYAALNDQYQQLIKIDLSDNTDSAEVELVQAKIALIQQKMELLKPLMTLTLTSLEIYGRTFAQPDDDKIYKRIHTNSNSLAGNAIGHTQNSASNSLIANIPGAYYKNGHWYMDYDKEGLVPLPLHQAKFIAKFPNGALAQAVKNKYLQLKNKKQ